ASQTGSLPADLPLPEGTAASTPGGECAPGAPDANGEGMASGDEPAGRASGAGAEAVRSTHAAGGSASGQQTGVCRLGVRAVPPGPAAPGSAGAVGLHV